MALWRSAVRSRLGPPDETPAAEMRGGFRFDLANYTTTGIIGEMPPSKRPAIFLGDTKKRLRQMPEPVRKDIGVALDIAQYGEKPNAAKPLRGLGGAGVLEIIDDYDGDTYRAVYTVQLVHAVYVLHAFQKKSKTGSKLPQRDAELIKDRLRLAEELDRSGIARTFSKEPHRG